WNVGVATERASEGPRLRQRLGAFLDQCGIRFAEPVDAPSRVVGRRIPLWDSHDVAHGPVALLGDAAGLADPFFGEGIASALASGRLAADASIRALESPGLPSLGDYAVTIRASLGRHLRRM